MNKEKIMHEVHLLKFHTFLNDLPSISGEDRGVEKMKINRKIKGDRFMLAEEWGFGGCLWKILHCKEFRKTLQVESLKNI